MLIEQIANYWARLNTKKVDPRSPTAPVDLERVGSTSGERFEDEVNNDGETKPYAPANNERVSESSQHFSC